MDGSGVHHGAHIQPQEWCVSQSMDCTNTPVLDSTGSKCCLMCRWSYGITLWEICTLGGHPYPSIGNKQLLQHILQGNRLEKPHNCSDDVWVQTVCVCDHHFHIWPRDALTVKCTFIEVCIPLKMAMDSTPMYPTTPYPLWFSLQTARIFTAYFLPRLVFYGFYFQIGGMHLPWLNHMLGIAEVHSGRW